ncbi:hypothetical protein ACQ4PT_055341 [Festuca glaucescens]
MARSGARNQTAQVRPSTSSPPQQLPSAPTSSCVNPSPQPQQFPGAPESSSANPWTPPHFYPSASMSSSANPSLNQWRPLYTPAPDGLFGFGQFSPMHPYNFQSQPMHHHEQGHQMMENLHFVGTSQHDSFSTPPPPHPKTSTRSAPAKVNPTSSKRKRKVINVDYDEPSGRTAHRLSYTPEEHVRLASAWLECSIDPIDGNGKKGEKFWDDIAVLYNSTTPSNRKRDQNQLKQEWQRTKKRLGAFHGEWTAVTGVYHSGYSTVDLEKMALEKYESNYGHPFQHLTMWGMEGVSFILPIALFHFLCCGRYVDRFKSPLGRKAVAKLARIVGIGSHASIALPDEDLQACLGAEEVGT